MVKKSRIQPLRKEQDSPSEALRILASLIAQFHMKKITGDKKPKVQATDVGELNNESLH